MKKALSIIIVLLGWFAIITQFYLIIKNRQASITETIIRYFSYFTILVNGLTALYFTREALSKTSAHPIYPSRRSFPGLLTAITIYITIVGLTYQFLLRHTWNPKGMDMVVDELLHTIIPLLVILFWYLYNTRPTPHYRQIPKWLIFPVLYLIYTLIRGSASDWYPYPFLNVDALGLAPVLTNMFFILLGGTLLSVLFVFLGKIIRK